MAIEGVLLDMEGVLVVAWQALPGAAEALRALRERGVPFLVATNATSVPRSALAEKLRGTGLDVDESRVVTAPVLTASYLRANHPGARCFLVGEPDIRGELEGVTLVDGDTDADVVLAAGADRAFTWENLSRAFRMLERGAALVAMHRNLFWMTEDGLMLDTGAFLVGLERAAGVEAVVTGKPSAEFFRRCVDLLGVEPERVAMVGDDLEADVLAAQDVGLTGVLVRTGKFRRDVLEGSRRTPDHVIDSIADLATLLP
jgi:HAD superfamily hydrolase (TIGR01458 family)